MGADLSAHNPMEASDVAAEALANLHNGPTYVVGEHNRAASEFILSPHNRGALVSSMSESSAGIAGDEMLPAARLSRRLIGWGLLHRCQAAVVYVIDVAL